MRDTKSSPKDGIFQSLADIALNIGRAGTAHETHIGKNRGCRLSSTVDHNGGHIISNNFIVRVHTKKHLTEGPKARRCDLVYTFQALSCGLHYPPWFYFFSVARTLENTPSYNWRVSRELFAEIQLSMKTTGIGPWASDFRLWSLCFQYFSPVVSR